VSLSCEKQQTTAENKIVNEEILHFIHSIDSNLFIVD